MWMLFGYFSLIITYLVRFILPAVEIILLILFLLLEDVYFLIVMLILLFLNITLYLILMFRYQLSSPVKANMLRKNDSDILLLISQKEIAKTSLENNFYKQDWSATWINTLEQEIGNFSVSDNAGDIKKKRWIVVSKSMLDISPLFIKKNIEKGKIILIEKPSESFMSYFGVIIVYKDKKYKKKK